MLLPSTCPACGRTGSAPCAGCIATMRAADPMALPRGLDACAALLAYEGAARQVVMHLKYRNARASARWLATGMAALVSPEGLDAVTWAPTSAARRRARGFDHAEVLARQVAKELGVPCDGLLVRLSGPPQTGRTLTERLAGPTFQSRAAIGGLAVLVVDDVVTSGGTLSAAATALRAGGASWVEGVASAHPR